MFTYILKYYFIIVFTIYSIHKILNYEIKYKSQKICLFIVPIFITLSNYLCKNYLNNYTHFISIILLWILFGLITRDPQISFIVSVISYGMNHLIYIFSSFLLIVVLSFFRNYIANILLTPLVLFAIGLHSIIIFSLFQIERFQKGMPFLFTRKNINIATILCLIVVAILTIFPYKRFDENFKALMPFFFILSLAVLIYWWKAQLTKTYKQLIAQRNTESLRTTLYGKNQEIEELTIRNHELGRLLHKYNKLIPALEHAVCEYLDSADQNISSIHEKGEELLASIAALTSNRKEMIANLNMGNYTHHKTGIPSLDALLNYLSEQSKEQHITFTVNNIVPLRNYIPDSVPEAEFTHMISDLLDNAFVAIRETSSGMIQLQFYTYADDLILEVADNGIPFEIKSLVNFGLKQMTTHEDTGGSGIGLMDIWKHKETCKASIHIEEYAIASPFTKKILIIFNKKNKYTISSYRKTDIQNMCNRLDLQMYEQIQESENHNRIS